MVTDEVWQQAGFACCSPFELLLSDSDDEPPPVYACIGCLEKRLGRRLQSRDFTPCPANRMNHPWHTERLRSRLKGPRAKVKAITQRDLNAWKKEAIAALDALIAETNKRADRAQRV